MIEILIPTFNGARYLNSQLSSIFNQSFFQWRILIRDDGSTDGTLELIEEWRSSNPERFFLISDNEKGLGVSQSFARLLAHSSASYVMLCDQDDS
jgi:glycosyltransferase involved in cell wall biosynthesis